MSETRDHISVRIDSILLGLPSSPYKLQPLNLQSLMIYAVQMRSSTNQKYLQSALFTRTKTISRKWSSTNSDDNILYLIHLFVVDISPWPESSEITGKVSTKNIDDLLGLVYKIWCSSFAKMTANRPFKTHQLRPPVYTATADASCYETYTKLKEIRSQGSGNTILSPQGSSTFIPEAWAEACGGIKNRHNSYGFGKSNSGSFTSSGTIPSNNTSNLEVEQLKEELQNMKNKQFEMDEKINQLLAITRTNHSNFSGHHFSPGQYSSPQYSGPSPGQYPPSASAPAGQYPAPAPAHSQYTATGSGQYPSPTPGYYPTPPPGYFMTPATQFHVPGNYIAPGQHPPVPTQQSDQLPSPDQRHSQE
ncbi:hypothetical protein BUALT_Bualt08G0111000 [Buddleja alternifolia]|uniref:Uncharacterized protein n=1 Tax=Buddleja alternifolia TaxID=168488 RepID=A0AAV6X5H1_9LAMI|nr:hypothetical protein BUALT_Bualt08G0111000 [Buddleja alternifolia]